MKHLRAIINRKVIIIGALVLAVPVVLAVPGYFVAKVAFETYFDSWGKKLVGLEKRGLLSKEFGAAWQDVLDEEAMASQAEEVLSPQEEEAEDSVRIVDGVRVADYPSLSIIARLNEVSTYSNTIEITDRRETPIATIRTDHTRAKIDEFPPTLIQALIAAEDGTFWTNELGSQFSSYVRAALRSALRTVTTFRFSIPRGTSTITQQVAKLFISRLDEEGRRYVGRNVDRKLREMRLAAAIREMYTPEEVLEVYLNHCVTSDYGLIGYKDIAAGLLEKRLDELTDAECIYLARMVKWGRNVRSQIIEQCRIDMPRMAQALGWDKAKQQQVLAEIDSLSFSRPRRIQTDHGILVDCANEFWLQVLSRNGMAPDRIAEMDIIDPHSLIRKKGDLLIRLTIDLALQEELERLVNARGYGPDTTIRTDVRIGSFGETIRLSAPPHDTLRRIKVVDKPREFSEPGSEYTTTLKSGDTLICNIRYRKTDAGQYRRSCFYYARRPIEVDGQYFAYAIMDSKTGKLLAYYSRDRIGSRLAGLLRHRIPNGSSTAKPIFNALNFDLGIFKPFHTWTDTVPVLRDVPWRRRIDSSRGKPIGVVYEKSAVRGRGYKVHNHDYIFEGCNYIFALLATSNNIFGVETAYRLDKRLFDRNGNVLPDAFPWVRFFYRLGALNRVKDKLHLKSVTGVRMYKELARIVGVDIDSMAAYGRRIPVSDSLYSVALGTLELTLYEQLHLYNVLYNNDLIERPADHPSLVIESILLNGDTVAIRDTVKRYHPFSDINNLRPTWLGMHKRLVSNKWDGLGEYDIPYAPPGGTARHVGPWFDPNAYLVGGPVANYAKSGTTDDVIRPFNVDVTSERRTNYGLWNAVLRLDLGVVAGDSVSDVRDVTVACMGECNRAYTGPRDGKTLHKFLTRDLLKKAGTKRPGGFYDQYEAYLRRVTPDSVRTCGASAQEPDSSDQPGESPLRSFIRKVLPRANTAPDTGAGDTR